MSGLMIRFVFCCLYLCLCCTASAVENRWIYRSLGPDMRSPEIIIDANRKVLTAGDLSTGLEICRSTESYYCFSSDFLSFAVPKDLSEESESWVYGGVEYRVLGHRKELVLGQEFSVFYIGTNAEGSDLVFCYSKKRGLIALSGASRPGTPLLIVDYCGFGAESKCRVKPR